jgi:hypothetical protein
MAVDLLPASALVHLGWVWDSGAGIIALDSALLADPVVDFAVNDFLTWAI